MRLEKQQRMFSLVEQWQASQMTKKEFCRHHQIKLSTFGYWNTRYRRSCKEPAGGFVQIGSGGGPLDGMQIIYPNGVRLSVAGYDAGLIGQLIHLW